MATFQEWFAAKRAEAEATDDGRAFRAAGFEVHHTGGGFVSWEKDIPGNRILQVTDDDGTGLFHGPDTLSWNVVILDNDGGEPLVCEEAPTVAAALAIADQLKGPRP